MASRATTAVIHRDQSLPSASTVPFRAGEWFSYCWGGYLLFPLDSFPKRDPSLPHPPHSSGVSDVSPLGAGAVGLVDVPKGIVNQTSHSKEHELFDPPARPAFFAHPLRHRYRRQPLMMMVI